MNNWTIERVKQELPKVQLRLMSGKIVTANVSGRKLKFAKVWYEEYEWDFAWETIARALNENRTLRVL